MAVYSDPKMDKELHLSGIDPKAETRVFSDLTEYQSAELNNIASEYWRYRENEDVEAQERVAHAEDESVVHEYYSKTPHYLYELSYWEASVDKQAWFDVVLKACRKYNLNRILDFGGGVGGLTLHMRRNGIRCDHLDVPGKTREYATWRFKKHGFDVEVLNAMDNTAWPWGQYDAVVAWDVLEHLFDLEGAIENINKLLRPGGWLIEKSTFAVEEGHHEHIHLAQHACYHDLDLFDKLLSDRGLKFVGQLKPDRVSRMLRSLGMKHAVSGIRIKNKLKHGGNFLVHEKA